MTVTMKHIYEEKAAIERGLRDFGDTVGWCGN